jgi:hypothetical protein
VRPRLRLLAELASDLRAAPRRRRDRRFAPISAPALGEERRSAAELRRRLDETRERLRRDIPPPQE